MADQRLTDLAPRLIAQDEFAIRQFVDESLPRLLQISRLAGASPEDAEEVALDTIDYTLRNLTNLDLSSATMRDPLFSYMAKVARTKTFERHRNQQKELNLIAKAVNLSLVALLRPVEGLSKFTQVTDTAVTKLHKVLEWVRSR